VSATIISGRDIGGQMRAEIKHRVAELKEEGLVPGLATVLVGEDGASRLYVGMKQKAANEAGMVSRKIVLPADAPEDELLGVLAGLNADPEIHGILVQLPLPGHIDEHRILLAVDPDKDVDGFHPFNVGRLATGDEDVLAPCTPAGVIEMLVRSGIETEGQHAVVVGRSNIVGRPMASLLVRRGRGGDATVTIVHSRTRDLASITRQADILIVAIGRPETITADMVKPGATVIDVGTTRIDDPTRERGFRVAGDVDFDAVAKVAGHLTPVPGGVGPMTITMLLANTVTAAQNLRALGRV